MKSYEKKTCSFDFSQQHIVIPSIVLGQMDAIPTLELSRLYQRHEKIVYKPFLEAHQVILEFKYFNTISAYFKIYKYSY